MSDRLTLAQVEAYVACDVAPAECVGCLAEDFCYNMEHRPEEAIAAQLLATMKALEANEKVSAAQAEAIQDVERLLMGDYTDWRLVRERLSRLAGHLMAERALVGVRAAARKATGGNDEAE